MKSIVIAVNDVEKSTINNMSLLTIPDGLRKMIINALHTLAKSYDINCISFFVAGDPIFKNSNGETVSVSDDIFSNFKEIIALYFWDTSVKFIQDGYQLVCVTCHTTQLKTKRLAICVNPKCESHKIRAIIDPSYKY